MSKIIPKDEFLSKVQCLRCGILGDVKICDRCKDLKKCKICSIILREKFEFYKYDPNKKGTVYKEHHYEIVSPFPEDKDGICTGCEGWEMGMKFWCFGCDNWFKNSLSNYKINGNFCSGCLEIINGTE